MDMTVNEQLMYTTLRIECFNEKNELFSIGTGFLLQRPIGEDKAKIYLVSNKHVLVGAKSISLTFTHSVNGAPEHGNNIKFPLPGIDSAVGGHPNPNVDVAVIDCTSIFVAMQGNIFYKVVSLDLLADFSEPELGVAENVYFVGYPDNRYDATNNLPLVRQGLIASHPKYDFNGNPVFIIDAQVFPGSSGSPVYIDLTFENMKNGQFVIGEKRIKLLGIIAQTMIRNNMLQVIPTGTTLTTQEVLGLGIVFKATTIRELIESIPM